MKKLVYFFGWFILSNNVFSQEIILTFNSTDINNPIDSITATNLETDKSVTVTETNTIQLSSIATSVELFNLKSSNFKLYPNPFKEHTNLMYYSENRDKLKISISNQAGQTVATWNRHISAGNNLFTISGTATGFYTVNIQSSSGVHSSKMICLQNSSQSPQIEYAGLSTEMPKNKSAVLWSGFFIHFRIYSEDNRTIIVDNPTESETYEVEFVKCSNNDDRNYAVVKIGEQWWMAENLAFLPTVSPSSVGSYTTKHFYVYGYEGTDVAAAIATSNYTTYGVLYNWPAAMNGAASTSLNPSEVQGICPDGWHLPSEEEWIKLTTYLGSEIVAGDKMKETGTTHWLGPNTEATNESGFSGLPGGYRNSNGYFKDIGDYGIWSSATEKSSTNSWIHSLYSQYNGMYRVTAIKENGFSVRCVRD